jgi:hypothetical protein
MEGFFILYDAHGDTHAKSLSRAFYQPFSGVLKLDSRHAPTDRPAADI